MNYWLIIILTIVGWCDAFFIYYKKATNKKMVCVIGEDCSLVLNSKYSRFLGIRMEIWGMGYYSVMLVISSIALTGVINTLNWPTSELLSLFSLLAAFGSLLLIFIQLVILKEVCEYCMLSAIVNFLLLIVIW